MDESLGSPASWPAPAKLNLCLHIVGRRADGYHLLQTAMQFIDLADELRFFRRPPGVDRTLGGAARCSAENRSGDPCRPPSGCTYRHRRWRGDRREKRHPGARPGWAAAVRMPQRCWSRSIELWRTGLRIECIGATRAATGCGRACFRARQAAWAEGVGERLTPIDLPEDVYLVVKPQAAVSTAEIFQAAELTRNSPVTTIRAFLAGGGRNDCTSTVRGRYPEIAEALDWLEEFGNARLTGTGACVFAAMAFRERCAGRLWRACRRVGQDMSYAG